MSVAQTLDGNTATTTSPARSAGSGSRTHKIWSNMHDVCNLLRIPSGTFVGDDDQHFQHVQFKAGQRIHTAGQPFDMLYIVNCGFLKSVMIDEFGNEQILSFPMKGDLFGIDGIHTKKYTSEAVALSSCDIILIPFAKFAALSRTNPVLETALYGLMSRELIREQGMITMLGSLTVEARVARFLVSLSERFSAIGYSGKAFNLPMTRREIGNYLGVTLETASRTLSAFNELGLISVDQRSIYIHDINALKTLRRLPPSRARIEQQEKKAAAAAASSEFIQVAPAPSGAMREQMAVV